MQPLSEMQKNQRFQPSKGAIIYYREGGRLSVIAGRQFFLVPPSHTQNQRGDQNFLSYAKKGARILSRRQFGGPGKIGDR